MFYLCAGELFRAALMLWVAAASEPELRDQIIPLEARMGREIHRVVVELLGVDESEPGVRETVQATLDLARGLGLANLLTDDSAPGPDRCSVGPLARRVVARRAPLTSASHPVRPPASSRASSPPRSSPPTRPPPRSPARDQLGILVDF